MRARKQIPREQRLELPLPLPVLPLPKKEKNEEKHDPKVDFVLDFVV
jgi:hypothetical protein